MASRNRRRLAQGLVGVIVLWAGLVQADDAKVVTRDPFRTDGANAHSPRYRLKPGEFPPRHSEHRVRGELVTVDFIHRRGQFRTAQSGELTDFRLTPFGAVRYLNAEADLRDVPLGTLFEFSLYQDDNGEFSVLATMEDQYSLDAALQVTHRLEELDLGKGRMRTTTQSLSKIPSTPGSREWRINDRTQVWKGTQPARLTDLAVGDELLINLVTTSSQGPDVCRDIWVGRDTHSLVTKQQRKQHAEFVRARGLPGWVDSTRDGKLAVTLFSNDEPYFRQEYLGDIAVGKDVQVVVANDELRTWNPPVDRERSTLQELQTVPAEVYGSSGVRLIVSPSNWLEGFRKGRIVRVFGPGWPCKDPDYGESLMGYGYERLRTAELMELTPKEYPDQFPFRTDYGNAHLPWYRVQSGVVPPPFSEHLVFGELVKADPEQRKARFQVDRKDEVVDVSLIPEGTVRYLNADATLADLPVGLRYRLGLYQDESGAFTRASRISDEYSYLAENALTYRIERLDLGEGKLHVARRIPEVKNYNGDMEQPPDIGRAELLVASDAHVWKDDREARLSDLAVGDLLLVNVTGERPGQPSRCADLWAGVETHKRVTARQSAAQGLNKGGAR